MSTGLQRTEGAFGPASPEILEKVALLHEAVLRCEQVEIATEHVLHGGMYVRTIRLQPGTVMVGSLIKLATVLIVHGSTSVLAGEDVLELEGYNVIPGCAGRKQVFVTRSHVEMTMVFPTSAKSVEEAEGEVFAEAEQLMSRRDNNPNAVVITGE
jgi:hypothetical protein